MVELETYDELFMVNYLHNTGGVYEILSGVMYSENLRQLS